MSNLILGIDGGGSKTIAWLARVPSDVDGTMAELEIIGQGHSGPSNPWSVGFDAACANLALAIENAQENGAISNPSIAVACLGLAGAGHAAVKRNFLEWANHRKLADETIVIDDVEPLALAAAYERHLDSASVSKNAFSIWQQSITLVAGTGSIACGRNAVGERVRVGGWGYLLGDEGSGFAIGMAGLQAICRAHDHAGPPTLLHAALLQQLEFDDPIQLVSFIYQSPVPRAVVAKLAETVISVADKDAIASAIVGSAIDSMEHLIATVAERLELAPLSYSLALSGGILSHQTIILRLLEQLARRNRSPVVSHHIHQPVYGPLVAAAMKLISS